MPGILKLSISSINAIRKYFDLVLRKVNSSDGIVISVGIIALITGILVDSFVVRLICLLVVVSAAIITIALTRLRQQDSNQDVASYRNADGEKSTHESEMKTLYFDDLGMRAASGEDSDRTGGESEPAGSSTEIPQIRPTPSPRKSVGVAHFTPSPVVAEREFRVADFFDLASSVNQGDLEPRTEFNFLLQKVLLLIKEVLFAHSVVFYWANREKGQMVMEARASDSANLFGQRRFAIGDDLVSRVAREGKPELLNEVNPKSEQEVLAYYTRTVGVKSFVGVPVYFTKSNAEQSPGAPIGVIAVDSRSEDAFGPETISLLGQFTKLISTLIKSYTDKYDLLLDSELLHSIRKLQEKIRNDFSLPTILQQLSDETSRLVRWDNISIVLFDEKRRACIVKKVMNRSPEEYLSPEQPIDFPESLVGQVIKSNSHQKIDDLEAQTLPRFQAGERMVRKGSFVAVPISSLNRCYGSLNVESRDSHNFSRQDIEILYRLAENAAFALEILYLEELTKEYVIIDDSTGLYSKRFFLQRLHEELQRGDDLSTLLTLVLISIDRSREIVQRYGADGFERMMIILSRAIRQGVRSYDLVGRVDADRFAVALVDTNANDAYLWAEKLRKNIAAHVINLEGRTFSVTMSVGLCAAVEGIRKDDLMANAVTVLNRSSEAGGNGVRVF